MLAVFKKELKSYLYTPIGYIFIAVFLFVFNFIFYQIINNGSSLFEYLFYSGATLITFILPVLTMRMFSEERRSGTEQLILTSPRSSISIVLGKFFAASVVVLIAELLTIVYYVILAHFGSPTLAIAIWTIVGFFLLSLCYISIGMFVSSLTENQIIACVATMLITFAMLYTTGVFNLVLKFDNFPQGTINLSDILSYLSVIVTFILLTVIVIQRRKTIK